ncbi:hypothetical protein [Roseateles koreensis]|uniref:Uncharacterized protein n=1 Tax=Roseateles koreensis TaxID=2987526 RepID=A0ABT5KM21_9BURK|nr:hypothetical protein [Roseateles koreensis]MDC8783962.1 hypothetical protein [Roseateles koreensis]
MNRCEYRSISSPISTFSAFCRPALVILCATAAVSLSAHAQTHRSFPANALRGELVVAQAPDVSLNGQAARLAPGARLRGDTQMLLQPASVSGQKLTVNYTLDPNGMLLDVWVLNTVELANKVWPRTALEASTWSFEPGTQTWTKR